MELWPVRFYSLWLNVCKSLIFSVHDQVIVGASCYRVLKNGQTSSLSYEDCAKIKGIKAEPSDTEAFFPDTVSSSYSLQFLTVSCPGHFWHPRQVSCRLPLAGGGSREGVDWLRHDDIRQSVQHLQSVCSHSTSLRPPSPRGPQLGGHRPLQQGQAGRQVRRQHWQSHCCQSVCMMRNFICVVSTVSCLIFQQSALW